MGKAWSKTQLTNSWKGFVFSFHERTTLRSDRRLPFFRQSLTCPMELVRHLSNTTPNAFRLCNLRKFRLKAKPLRVSKTSIYLFNQFNVFCAFTEYLFLSTPWSERDLGELSTEASLYFTMFTSQPVIDLWQGGHFWPPFGGSWPPWILQVDESEALGTERENGDTDAADTVPRSSTFGNERKAPLTRL